MFLPTGETFLTVGVKLFGLKKGSTEDFVFGEIQDTDHLVSARFSFPNSTCRGVPAQIYALPQVSLVVTVGPQHYDPFSRFSKATIEARIWSKDGASPKIIASVFL